MHEIELALPNKRPTQPLRKNNMKTQRSGKVALRNNILPYLQGDSITSGLPAKSNIEGQDLQGVGLVIDRTQLH